MELTLEEAVENHRKLWNEIARIIKETGIRKWERVDYLKTQALRNLGMPTDIKNQCFLCEYANWDSLTKCQGCPLTPDTVNYCLGGVFPMFVRLFGTRDSESAYAVAIEIANMPIVNRGDN